MTGNENGGRLPRVRNEEGESTIPCSLGCYVVREGLVLLGELVVLSVLVGRTEVIGAARLVEPGDQFISFSLSVSGENASKTN